MNQIKKMKRNYKNNNAVSSLLGLAIGDALGVPYEFYSREIMDIYPASGMVGYGTHEQPAGTWSDDTSLSLCLAEALTEEFDLTIIASKFVNWRFDGYLSARGSVFDIGKITRESIDRLNRIIKGQKFSQLNELKNVNIEHENGNGSLMRILPLLFYIHGKNINKQFEITRAVSALTHRHIRSAMACFIYLKLAGNLLIDMDKSTAYKEMKVELNEFFNSIPEAKNECQVFKRVLEANISNLKREEITSDAYVVNSLEAALWCFLKEEDFSKTILTAVNLGGDTDTIAAISGCIAGLYYGADLIPNEWLDVLARKNEIIELGVRLNNKFPMEYLIKNRINRVLEELRANIDAWEKAEDEWEWCLEEEGIYELTIGNIAIEYFPIDNKLLVEDCRKAVAEGEILRKAGESGWNDFHTIMKDIDDGKYGNMLPHIQQMAKMIVEMYY